MNRYGSREARLRSPLLIFPVAVLTAFTILAGAYFVMKNVFYAQGMVSILIELVGGTVFLIVILRKGRL